MQKPKPIHLVCPDYMQIAVVKENDVLPAHFVHNVIFPLIILHT